MKLLERATPWHANVSLSDRTITLVSYRTTIAKGRQDNRAIQRFAEQTSDPSLEQTSANEVQKGRPVNDRTVEGEQIHGASCCGANVDLNNFGWVVMLLLKFHTYAQAWGGSTSSTNAQALYLKLSVCKFHSHVRAKRCTKFKCGAGWGPVHNTRTKPSGGSIVHFLSKKS